MMRGTMCKVMHIERQARIGVVRLAGTCMRGLNAPMWPGLFTFFCRLSAALTKDDVQLWLSNHWRTQAVALHLHLPKDVSGWLLHRDSVNPFGAKLVPPGADYLVCVQAMPLKNGVIHVVSSFPR